MLLLFGLWVATCYCCSDCEWQHVIVVWIMSGNMLLLFGLWVATCYCCSDCEWQHVIVVRIVSGNMLLLFGLWVATCYCCLDCEWQHVIVVRIVSGNMLNVLQRKKMMKKCQQNFLTIYSEKRKQHRVSTGCHSQRNWWVKTPGNWTHSSEHPVILTISVQQAAVVAQHTDVWLRQAVRATIVMSSFKIYLTQSFPLCVAADVICCLQGRCINYSMVLILFIAQ